MKVGRHILKAFRQGKINKTQFIILAYSLDNKNSFGTLGVSDRHIRRIIKSSQIMELKNITSQPVVILPEILDALKESKINRAEFFYLVLVSMGRELKPVEFAKWLGISHVHSYSMFKRPEFKRLLADLKGEEINDNVIMLNKQKREEISREIKEG